MKTLLAGSNLIWIKGLQYVTINNTKSSTKHVPHGIPQGSILGPSLFLIFINDLPLTVNTSVIDLYADDTTLTCSAHFCDTVQLQESLNNSMATVNNWATINKLPNSKNKDQIPSY
jgi:hypothetical protein